MGSTVKWLRLTEAFEGEATTARQAAVKHEIGQYRGSLNKGRRRHFDVETALDTPGVYVNERCTAYRVVYTAVERDKRGHIHRRQRTRNFHRTRGDYGDAGPLKAAATFKTKMDHVTRRDQPRARSLHHHG